MSPLAEEAARLIESLPPEKARALIEYARYLAEKSDEDDWDRRFNNPTYAAKLKARMAEVEREIQKGNSEPLDHGRL
jgi:hypothetical protein